MHTNCKCAAKRGQDSVLLKLTPRPHNSYTLGIPYCLTFDQCAFVTLMTLSLLWGREGWFIEGYREYDRVNAALIKSKVFKASISAQLWSPPLTLRKLFCLNWKI